MATEFFAVWDVQVANVGIKPGTEYGEEGEWLEYETTNIKANGATIMDAQCAKLKAKNIKEAQSMIKRLTTGSNSEPILVTTAAWKET